MQRPSRLIYNDLTGEEAKEILLRRFTQMLDEIPDLKRHIALVRANMTISLSIDVHGRVPPSILSVDQCSIESESTPPHFTRDVESTRSLSANINSDTVRGGDPPDKVREENGLPVYEQVRNSAGQTIDRPRRKAEPKTVDGIPYAAHVTLDRGGAVVRGNMEFPEETAPIPARVPQGRVERPDFSRLSDPSYTEQEEERE